MKPKHSKHLMYRGESTKYYINKYRNQGKDDEKYCRCFKNILDNNNPKYHVYSEKEDLLVLKMVELGFTYKNIARALNVTYNSIKSKMKRLRNKR